MKLYRPYPIDQEIQITSKEMMVTKTNMLGDIIYINKTFTSLVGYTKNEIIGTPHDALRHPDMPEAIFFLISQAIQQEQKITAIVKNLSKSGEYYWAVTDFETLKGKSNTIDSYIAFRQAIPEHHIFSIIELYDTLLQIEKRRGMDASLHYLQRHLAERKTNYNELIKKVSRPKSIISRLFTKSKAQTDTEKSIYRVAA
ncbi:MAG TPA: PAS domain S-box protein [Campylobacterales bacterium]|nr:PAS domain S-box protein [Campylobacterales bacterium]